MPAAVDQEIEVSVISMLLLARQKHFHNSLTSKEHLWTYKQSSAQHFIVADLIAIHFMEKHNARLCSRGKQPGTGLFSQVEQHLRCGMTRNTLGEPLDAGSKIASTAQVQPRHTGRRWMTACSILKQTTMS